MITKDFKIRINFRGRILGRRFRFFPNRLVLKIYIYTVIGAVGVRYIT